MVGVVALTILGIYLSYSSIDSTKSDVKIIQEKASFNFNPNNKSHYTLKYKTIFDNKNSAYKIADNINVAMNVDVRVFKKEKNSLYVGFQFSDVNSSFHNNYLEKRVNDLYSIFFLIKMNYEGKFLQYYFPKKIENIKGLIRLISLLQNILKNQALYSCTELDANGGVYNTAYRLQNHTLYKTREKYISPEQNDINTIIKNSNFKIELDSQGNWIKTLHGKEKLVTKEDGNTIVKNTNSLTVDKLETPVDKNLQIWLEKRDVENIIKALSKQQAEDEFSWKKEQDKSLKKLFKKGHITLKRLLTKVKRLKSLSSRNDLIAYLKLNRDEIHKLYDTLLESDDAMASILINILEMLHTPEAQALLVKLVDDEKFSTDNQLRAAIALGTQKNLSQELINELWDIQSNHDNEEDKTRANTILLALGSISSQTNQSSSDTIDQQLKDLLYDETSNKTALLYSMENSGAAKFKSEIVTLLKTTKDKNLKSVCIKVLKNIKSDAVKTLLFNEMKNGSSDLVRATAIEALRNFKTDDKVVQYIQGTIKTISDFDTKNEMVYYLIKTVNTHPENKKYLMDILNDIQDSRTKKAIIKTIRNAQ